MPLRPPSAGRGALEILVDPQWDLVGLYVYHAFLICSLVSWALIAKDGFRVPRGCLIVALIVGFGGPLFSPELHPVPWLLPRPESWSESWPVRYWLPRVDTSVVGILVGGGLGWLLDRLTTLGYRHRLPRQAMLGWGLVGVTLGWQAAISVGVLTGLIAVLQRAAGGLANALDPGWSDTQRARGWFAYTALAVTAQLFCWRLLSELPWWPGPFSPPLVMVLAAAVGLALNLAAGSEIDETPSATLPPDREDGTPSHAAEAADGADGLTEVLAGERPEVERGSVGTREEERQETVVRQMGGSAGVSDAELPESKG